MLARLRSRHDRPASALRRNATASNKTAPDEQQPPGPAHERPGHRGRLVAIAFALAAVLGFACIDTSGKWLNQYMDPLQTVWVRYFGSVVFVLALVNPLGRPRIFVTRAPGLQATRSLLLLVSTILNFWALVYLQLSEMSAISFSAPLMVALLAGPLIGEWAGPRRLAAIAVGFLGVLVITRPGLGGFQPAALLSVASACASAGYTLTTRMLAARDPPETTMVYSGAAGVVLLTPIIPFIWTEPASLLIWGVMVLCGFAGAVGHWFLILACRHAPAPVLAPFSYTHIIWATLLSYWVFGQVPDAMTLVGAGIVIASGLYLLHRERIVAKAPVSAHSLTAPVIDDT
ncbi:DMT family transporter [Chelatococcus sp. GCM10030263]|uniref:DMT family transporter n=1 Tax=Chelatococcus sp. GCM10030263 TaxID=3273387 RepID=UPI003619AC11